MVTTALRLSLSWIAAGDEICHAVVLHQALALRYSLLKLLSFRVCPKYRNKHFHSVNFVCSVGSNHDD